LIENNLITLHIKEMLLKGTRKYFFSIIPNFNFIGFDTLIDENRYTSVALMYDLFLRIGQTGNTDLRVAFGNYIKVKQKEIFFLIFF
jgi:hypothetical protein